MENGAERPSIWAGLPLIAALARLLRRELNQGEMKVRGT